MKQAEELKPDQDALDKITIYLEEFVSSYVVESIEDLYDEDEDAMVRCIEWNHGIRNYKMVINAQGQIKWLDKGFPKSLIVDTSNAVIEMLYDVLDDVISS